MLRYVLRRLLGAIPTLFVVVTVTFFLMRLAPGGPFDQEQALTAEIQANQAVMDVYLSGDLRNDLVA